LDLENVHFNEIPENLFNLISLKELNLFIKENKNIKILKKTCKFN